MKIDYDPPRELPFRDQTMIKVEQESARAAIKTLLRFMGEDPDREGLVDTPDRVLMAWIEHTEGYHQDPEQILAKNFGLDDVPMPNGSKYDELILSRDIPFVSHCEHHLAQITGTAHVAYIPNEEGRVVGLSKLARLVDCFAKRLQVQERLTEQIAQTLEKVLEPRGVAVIIHAKHACQHSRGVRKDGSMVTSALYGYFRENRDGCRGELMDLIAL